LLLLLLLGLDDFRFRNHVDLDRDAVFAAAERLSGRGMRGSIARAATCPQMQRIIDDVDELCIAEGGQITAGCTWAR
jgi:hypothetical protein